MRLIFIPRNILFVLFCFLFLSLFLGSRMPSYSIILIAVFWIYLSIKRGAGFNFSPTLSFLLPVFFFLWSALSLLWSDTPQSGVSNLETRLSFVILPLIFFQGGLKDFVQHNFLRYQLPLAFFWITYLSILISFSHSIFLFWDEIRMVEEGLLNAAYTNYDFFYSSYLSFKLHPTYYAMYISVALVVGLEYIFKKELSRRQFFLYLFVCFQMLVFLVFLASKAGYLILLLIGGYYFFRWAIEKRRLLSALIVLAVFSVSSFFLLRNNKIISSRFTYAIEAISNYSELDPASTESNTVRIFIWKAAVDLIGQNVFLGTGTGDISAELNKEYDQRGMVGAKDRNLNCHNQFLQTFLELGIIGIGILVMIFIHWWKRSLKDKNHIGLWAILIVIISGVTESVFQTQAGVLFLTVFFSLTLSGLFTLSNE